MEAQADVWGCLLLDGAPGTECWACGSAGALERAHIVPRRAGGSDEPSNFLLLCGRCHEEQPDDAPPEVQLFWLRHHPARSTLDLTAAVAWCRAVTAGLVTEGQALELARAGVSAP